MPDTWLALPTAHLDSIAIRQQALQPVHHVACERALCGDLEDVFEALLAAVDAALDGFEHCPGVVVAGAAAAAKE